jgi:ABC-type polysaccharide/polyol phosphate export permease
MVRMQEMYENAKPLKEVVQAAILWPIWLRIGLLDIQMRYRRSALGVGYVFINLAVMVFALGAIYSHILGQDLRIFLPFLTIGLVSWGYLTSSIVEGGSTFIISEGYIKQIGLPLYVYVFRSFVRITATTLLTLPAYFIVAIVYSVDLRWGALWALFGILLLGIVSFLMIAIFAHLNVRIRDTAYIASMGLQVMFFVTPIIWPPESLRFHYLRWVINLNPFYHLLEVIRHPLVMSEPATPINYLVVFMTIVCLSIVAWVFTKWYIGRIAYLL